MTVTLKEQKSKMQTFTKVDIFRNVHHFKAEISRGDVFIMHILVTRLASKGKGDKGNTVTVRKYTRSEVRKAQSKLQIPPSSCETLERYFCNLRSASSTFKSE